MVWCSNCTKRQPSQSARSILQCCNGCGKVVNQQTGSKCENELLNNLNAVKSVKSGMAIFKVCKNAKGAVNGKGSNESLSDIDDVEIGRYLLKEDEKLLKKIIWERMNKKYAKAEADRKAAAENALKLKKEKQQRQAAEAKETRVAAKTTNKRTSSRVNYDVLKELLGSFRMYLKRVELTRIDDAASNKNVSEHNKFSDWGLLDDDYDEENYVENQGDRYNDYEEQYYDDNDDGLF